MSHSLLLMTSLVLMTSFFFQALSDKPTSLSRNFVKSSALQKDNGWLLPRTPSRELSEKKRRRFIKRKLREDRKVQRKQNKNRKIKNRKKIKINESIYTNDSPDVGSITLNHRSGFHPSSRSVQRGPPRSMDTKPSPPRSMDTNITTKPSELITKPLALASQRLELTKMKNHPMGNDVDMSWIYGNISSLWKAVRSLQKDINFQKQSSLNGKLGGKKKKDHHHHHHPHQLRPTVCESSTKPENCTREGESSECSNRGECVCGYCECSKDAYGQFCQCDDRVCMYNHGMICSGPSHGECRCGNCICQPGFAGEACECSTDTSTCVAPSNDGQLCSGKGECKCGDCSCDEGFSGKYCENEIYAAGVCERLKSCVLCKAFGRKMPQCSHCRITVNTVDELEPKMNTCVMISRGCLFKYSYVRADNGAYVVSVAKDNRCRPEA